MERTDEVIEEIFSLYEKFGEQDYIGEAISQIEHMSQAAQLAIQHGHDDEVVLAAFFHDIGHLCVNRTSENDLNGYGTKNHEQLGAKFLREKGFPERVAKLVENHVPAKRYLCFRYPAYYNSLSEASRNTLSLQGGVMSDEEARRFEADPLFPTSILLRQWDEQAKEKNVPLIDLSKMKLLAKGVLLSNLQAGNHEAMTG